MTMAGAPKNHAASVRQRLLNHSRAHKEGFQRVVTRYAIERLLYRLSTTKGAERYVLKDAMLFLTWPQHVFRPTGDLDLLARGDADPASVREFFSRVCEVDLPEDGITFDPSAVRVEQIRDGDKSHGIRLTMTAELAGSITRFHVDVGYGDHVYPPPRWGEFPTLLAGLPKAAVLMYPPETVIAEKLETMITFGEANSRLKDFYDIWILSRTFDFDLATLAEAVGGTLRRRESDLPVGMPVALTDRFANSPETQSLWSGFLSRQAPTVPPPPFEDVLADLRRFLLPVLEAIRAPETSAGRWNSGHGNWV